MEIHEKLCCCNKLRYDMRSLEKEKIPRTAWMFRIQVFFDLPAVIFVIADGQLHNLTTVMCLENPAKAGIIVFCV